MAERTSPGPVSNIKDCEAVCIHTKKIYDSCREKDISFYKKLPIKKRHQDFIINSSSKSAGFVFFSLL